MLETLKNSNKWLASAALLSFAATALHLIVGTPELMHPLYSSNTPPVSIATAEVMWNGIAILCVVAGVTLLYAAVRPKVAIEVCAAIIALFIGMTALFVVTGMTKLGELSSMPQWQFFGLLPLLTIIGLFRNKMKNV